ncbi:MAG: hypothetical protein Q8898_16275, partial [Bacillota bacterium]|nr:hypothetical protein [Bacillota bacterium]
EEIQNGELTAARKLEIYRQYLDNVNKSDKENSEYLRGRASLETDAKKENLAIQKAQFEKNIADEKMTVEEVYKKKIEFAKSEVAAAKEGTVEKANAEKEQMNAEKDYEKWKKQLNQTVSDGEREHSLSLLDVKQEEIDKKKDLEEISEVDSLRLSQDVENQRYVIERASLARRLELENVDAQKQAEIKNQIQALDDKHAQQTISNAHQISVALANEKRSLNELLIEQEENHQSAMLDIAEDRINDERQLGQITEADQVKQEIAIEQRRYAIERNALLQKQALVQNDKVQYQQIQNQILALDDQYTQAKLNNARRLAMAQNQIWFGMVDTMKGLFNQGLVAMSNGTLNWKNSMKAIYQSLVQYFAGVVSDIVGNWMKGQLMKRLISKQSDTQESSQSVIHATAEQAALTSIVTSGEMARQIVTTQSNVAILASGKTSALAMVGASAAAYEALLAMLTSMATAIAAIWPVGTAMSVPMFAGITAAQGIMTAATSAASASIMAFDVGTMNVPQDMLAMVHKGEVIIPEKFSDSARRFLSGEGSANGGGGGGDTNYWNVSAYDAQGVKGFIRRNSDAFIDAAKRAKSDGKLDKKW